MNKNRVAIYCRLSKDDEQIGDSVSISTQKMLLSGYCQNQGFEIIDIYIDDGFSGLNFNRPSFKRMVNDIEDGKIDIVVTKDLSRLGRDYIQTGYYIDVYFSTEHIRYIAVNDGIDTLLDNNDIAPFKNILNDMYAKDLSRKVKSAKTQRAKNGLYISAQPPYGYKVDPTNKNKLIVDNDAAKNVKYIFDLAAEGKNYSEISRTMESLQIISPSAYKALNGDTRFIKFAMKNNLYKWPYQTIATIIGNRVYAGDMVNHKMEVINYKTKKRVKVPLNEQIVVTNTHEAIIDRDTFEYVNAKVAKRRHSIYNHENIFKGLVFCAECGEEMQLITRSTKAEKTPMFRCAKHTSSPEECTHYHAIYYNELKDEIQRQFTSQIENLINSPTFDDLCKIVVLDINNRAQKRNTELLQKELQAINIKIKDYYRAFSSKISATEIEQLYNAQKSILKKLTAPPDDNKVMSNEIYTVIKPLLAKCLIKTPVNQDTLHILIEKVEIGHLEKSGSGTAKQSIKIHYHF